MFCPALTDGAFGDQIFFNAYNLEGLKMDCTQDVLDLYDRATNAETTAAIILGGGMIKSQVLNANKFRGGLDYAVYINIGHQHDQSETGRSPEDEKLSKKIKGKSIKINSEVSLIFPLLVAETFYKRI